MNKNTKSDDVILIDTKSRVFEPVWDKIKESVKNNNMVPIRNKITSFYVKPEDDENNNGYQVNLVLELLPKYRDVTLYNEHRSIEHLYIVSLRAVIKDDSIDNKTDDEFLVMDATKEDSTWASFIRPFVKVDNRRECCHLQTFTSSYNTFFNKFNSNTLKFVRHDPPMEVDSNIPPNIVIHFPIKVKFKNIPIQYNDYINLNKKRIPPVSFIDEETSNDNKLGNVSFNLVSKKELPEELNINGVLYKRVHDDTVK